MYSYDSPKRHRHAISFIIVCSVILLLSFGTAHGQEDQPVDVVKVYSNLVSVPVIVSDRDGRYLPGLRQEDFKLFDNGTQQTLSFFDAAEEPLNVLLLLDTSHSTERVLDDIKKAAKNFLKELRPQDRAMIVSFDYQINKLSPLTNNRKVLEKAIKNAEVGEIFGTLLNDAVMEGVERDLKPINGRKAIILLTDGEDAGSYTPEDDLVHYAAESDAMIYSIYYSAEDIRPKRDPPWRRDRGIFGGRGPRRDRSPGPGGRRQDQRRQRREERKQSAMDFLAKLSEVSAGRFYQSENTDLKKTFVMIAQELRNQYRLGFVPDNLARDGSLHALKVKVDRPDISVRARTQYRAMTTK